MRAETWTANRVELLKQLWIKGETAVAIGARLGGISRSAVLGKVFRLRLGDAGASTSASSEKHAANGQSKAAPTRGPAVHTGNFVPASTHAKPSPKNGSDDALTWRRGGARRTDFLQQQRHGAPDRRKTLLELTNDCCRWPFGRAGKFFFCGAVGADLDRGVPYCPRHMRRAHPPNATVTVETRKPSFKSYSMPAGRWR